MIALIRAVDAVTHSSDYDDETDGRPLMRDLHEAFAAYRAEIAKRRAESPWKGPFGVGMVDVLDVRMYKVAKDVSFEQGQAQAIADSLNAFYGYFPDANGQWIDVLAKENPDGR